jgi:hypothetical protein
MQGQADTIMAITAANRDIMLAEVKASLAERQVEASVADSGASSAATGSRSEKSAHACDRGRVDVLKRREDWFDGQLNLNPDRLVSIDETWASTNMTRKRGRGPKRRTPADGRAARPLEEHDLRRRADVTELHRALRPQRSHRSKFLRDLC